MKDNTIAMLELREKLEDIEEDMAILQALINNFEWHHPKQDSAFKEMYEPIKRRWKKLSERKRVVLFEIEKLRLETTDTNEE